MFRCPGFLPSSHLCTQVEVAQQDGGLGAGDEEDDEDQEQEAEHVVHLVRPGTQHRKQAVSAKRPLERRELIWEARWLLPDAVEDEEELDEDAAEGQDAAHDDAGDGLGEERLLRDLTGDLIGPDWLLDRLQDTRQRRVRKAPGKRKMLCSSISHNLDLKLEP